MAIKLSNYSWFKGYLTKSLEDKWTAREYFGEELSPEDKKTLQFIIEELDRLKEESNFQEGKPLLARNIVLPNVIELKDITSDPKLAAALFKGIYKIMEKHMVNIELYRQLGRCFDEIGQKPDPDIAEAIEYALRIRRTKRHYSHERMCWETIKKVKKKRF